MFRRPENEPWSYLEESLLAEIGRRPAVTAEFQIIVNFRRRTPPDDKKFLPQSVQALLENWTKTLDRARNAPRLTPESTAGAVFKPAPDAKPITEEQRAVMAEQLKALKAEIKKPGG